MLAPRAYTTDCLKLVGKIIDCNYEYYTDNEKTLTLWKETYPDAPLELDVDETPKEDFEYESTLSYDVMAAVLRQKLFNYQVSLPHYTDNTFIDLAIERYKKFLYMRLKHKNLFVVPTYDMDIVWHTHQVYPVLYKEDTERILGEHLNHDDSVNDRKPGSKLNRSSAATRSTWREMYAEDYSSFGCMFRGNPTNGKLATLALGKDPYFEVVSKYVDIEVKSIRIESTRLKPKKIKYMKAQIYRYNNHDDFVNLTTQPDKNMCWAFGEYKKIKIRSHPKYSWCWTDQEIKIELGEKPSLMQKMKNIEVIWKGNYDLIALVATLEARNVVYDKTIEIPFKYDDTSKVILNLLLTVTTDDYIFLDVSSTCKSEPEIVSWPANDREAFWGPIPFSTIRPTEGRINKFTNRLVHAYSN